MTQNIANHDFIVLIDFSGSMATIDSGQKLSRIDRVKESVLGLVSELAAVDEDGIEIITFGSESILLTSGVKNAEVLNSVFSRRVAGGTPTAEALAKAFEVAGKSDKPDFIVVFTDGEPNNRQAVKDVLIKQANSQNADGDLTVLFIQVGNDTAAGAFLDELDDALIGAKFDIVDKKTQAEADAYPTLAALIADAIDG
ncbi:VWA domain-containing protein [Zoogloea dura]|uniref:VWA domain-containing protein n=1 Tax=Zoogloea dura TaxID=2728840 RepID=A0A848FWJ4_9RHOO|nr:VWA domain-containing protein [Zoogloea dura]NML24307.1 VWA domain-containing protein [Zoogloea dura]